MVEKLIPYLFYTLFFSIPLVFVSLTSELFEFNKMIATYILATLIVGLWLIKMILRGRIIFRRTIIDKPLILFLISQTLATLVSIDTRTSLLGYYSRFNGGLASSISYSLLYWAYVSNMDAQKTRKALTYLLASGILVSLYGVAEHFGIDKDLWVQDVQNRVFSTLGQPNWLAAWLAAVTPIIWVFTLETKFRSKKFWLTIAISSLFFLTLLYTKSRSGFLGFTTSYIVFWLAIFWQNSKKIQVFAKSMIIITLSFAALILFAGSSWTPRLQATGGQASPVNSPALEVGGTESGKIRQVVWKGAIEIWKHYPILGTGVETFAFAYYQFRPPEHNLVSEWEFLYNKAHNEYLNYLATTGLVGLGSYLILIGAISYILIFTNYKSRLALALVAGFASILITNFFGFSVVPVSLLFFLFPAMAEALANSQQSTINNQLSNLSATQKVLLLIVVSCLSLVVFGIAKYWYADVLYERGKELNNEGNPVEARKNLISAINLSSNEAVFWNELAGSAEGISSALAERGDGEKAKEFAQEGDNESKVGTSLSPHNITVARGRARLFIKLSTIDPSYLEKARMAIETAILLAPTDPKLYYNLGLTEARLEETDEAIRALSKAVDLKANYKDARLALSILLSQEGKRQEARDQLNYILKNISPDDQAVKSQLEEIGK